MTDETTDVGGRDFDDATLEDARFDEQFSPPRDRSREAKLFAAGLSVVAGVLCVVAPFRAVYTLRAQGISVSFDGWGRYNLASASQHGPRYGIALTVAALVLVIAASTRLRDLRPLPDPDPEHPIGNGDDRLAAAVGIAGSALLLGVLGAVALNIESTESNADSIAGAGGTATAVSVGGMLWILLGAWVLSVVALYLPWFEARRRL